MGWLKGSPISDVVGTLTGPNQNESQADENQYVGVFCTADVCPDLCTLPLKKIPHHHFCVSLQATI